uniref:Transmembrane protein n=1 Tax=Hyaloperonospora arabidopsidis (strain Emoy2) TaxID=559515 RepID=M4BNE2_HYAAE
MYGSLRKGDPLKFFSKECAGIVAATIASAFSTECLNSVIEPMLKHHFSFSGAELAAVLRLISMPSTFCFFFGMLSDCYPIMGFRRKAYLIICLVVTVLSYFVLSALNAYAEGLEKGTGGTGLVVGMVTFATVASTANMVTFMCVRTRVIELSQRESLAMRGAMIGTYVMFRFAVCMVTYACVYAVRSSALHHSTEMVLYGISVAFSIPLVWKVWQEKYYSLSTSMKTRGQILWKVMQQKAVWTILLFLCISTFFNSIKFGDPDLLIRFWAGVSSDNILLQQVMTYGVMSLMVIVWRYFLMNRPWRAFFAMSTVLLVVSQCIVAIFVSLDILRSPYFYRVMTIFPSIATCIYWLATIVPLTEIIQEGSEGAIVGLMMSLHYSVLIFVQTNSAGLFRGTDFYDHTKVALDSPNVRSDVLMTVLLNYGINALALIGIYFLPQQKLHTQQLRSFGGYTKCASATILAFIVMLFLYSLVVTLLALLSSTSCLGIAGGDGC